MKEMIHRLVILIQKSPGDNDIDIEVTTDYTKFLFEYLEVLWYNGINELSHIQICLLIAKPNKGEIP